MQAAIVGWVVVLAGCGAQSPSAGPQGSGGAVAARGTAGKGGRKLAPACSFYSVTLAVGLLERHPIPASTLRGKAGRRGWGKLVAEAHRANRVFDSGAFTAVARNYRLLLERLDAADAALERGDLLAYRHEFRGARAPLKAAEAAADKTTLGCKIVSKDGSATLTFGKG